MKFHLKNWAFWGPIFVIAGAALWGTETYFRVHLNDHFDSEVLVFHEHLFCIAFTLPVFLFHRSTRLRGIPLSSWIYLLLSGAIGSAIGTTLFTLSLRTLNPSVANILLNFQPIVSVTFAQLLLNEKLGQQFWLWTIFALACGLAIVWGDFRVSEFTWSIGLVYIALTALAWGFSTVAGRGAMLHMPLTTATLGRFVVGAVTLAVSLLFKGKLNSATLHWSIVPHVAPDFVWLSLVAGVIPLFLYFQGLSRTSASVGGFCELTQTFSALILTWGIMGQALTAVQVIAGCLLLFSVYKINLNYAKANGPGTMAAAQIRAS